MLRQLRRATIVTLFGNQRRSERQQHYTHRKEASWLIPIQSVNLTLTALATVGLRVVRGTTLKHLHGNAVIAIANFEWWFD
jgi:hypothetical protein